MLQFPINLQYSTIKDPLPGFIHTDIAAFSANANGYKSQPTELVDLLAKKHGVPQGWIFLTAGIDEAIQIFIRGLGDTTAVFLPSYSVYADAELFGKNLVRIPSLVNNEYVINSAQIPNATLIFLANPNNPAGFSPKDKVIELIANNPQSTVVIDEAYNSFAPELSVLDQLERFENLVVFRSFSKDYGMAGNRVGYVIARPEIIARVKDHTQWANVSYLSIGAAVSALNHQDYFSAQVKDIISRRDRFTEFLEARDFVVIPTKINVVLIKFENVDAGSRFFNYLGENEIIASHGNGKSNIGLDESFVRIAIGNDEQMEYVMGVINRFKL